MWLLRRNRRFRPLPHRVDYLGVDYTSRLVNRTRHEVWESVAWQRKSRGWGLVCPSPVAAPVVFAMEPRATQSEARGGRRGVGGARRVVLLVVPAAYSLHTTLLTKLVYRQMLLSRQSTVSLSQPRTSLLSSCAAAPPAG